MSIRTLRQNIKTLIILFCLIWGHFELHKYSSDEPKKNQAVDGFRIFNIISLIQLYINRLKEIRVTYDDNKTVEKSQAVI